MSRAISSRQIVLAEDNPADVGLVREALREHHVACDLRVIADGEEVLAFLARLDRDNRLPCPDLLLLDLSLPRYDGREILKYLRASERCGQTPVVVLSSSDWIEDREAAAKNAAVHYFKKPSSLAQFLKLGVIIKDVMEMRRKGAGRE
ncbi:MAG TPA: response regulator [Bryobacteraceae bacterium]|jgi:CheY-like chemotaxis protein